MRHPHALLSQSFQVALTMCGIARLEQPMLQVLKRAVLASSAGGQPGSGYAWLAAASGARAAAEAGRVGGAGLEESLLRAVR